MAEEQKNVEVPQETKPETTPAPATETPAESAPATEAKPVEEGHLGHKDQGFSFPKSLIASKEFFFFGTDAFEPKALAHYLKTEKSAETAHSNIAWASHTGKGLLFFGDKKNPSGIISLADATEPETDGSHKFHFTSKGNKHSFKAANTAERDNWVAQLKLKIAEAKELASTVTESEAYKKTIESFKPAPPKKEEAKAEESVSAPATEETPKEAKAEESVSAPATEETPKEAKAEESVSAPATEEIPKEAKAEESVSAPATEETPKEAKAEESVSAPATEETPKETPKEATKEELEEELKEERITRILQQLQDRVESLENQLKDMKDMSTKMDKNMEALMGMFEEFMKASAVTSEAAK